MAWKGTRPPGVVDRDNAVQTYLNEHGMASRNAIADALGLERSKTYLSLFRLREAGKAKRCLSESGELLWTTDKDKPCP